MSTTIGSLIVMLLSQLLPSIGVEVGSEQLTQALSTIITVLVGIYLWYKRYKQGDITITGKRK